MVPTLFDRYIAVDWSANNSPKRGKDSIWVAMAVGGHDGVETLNISTRRQAEAWLQTELIQMVRTGSRVLVGFDVPYGYPAGFAAAIGAGRSWADVWSHLAEQIEDDPRNRSNRFLLADRMNQALGADAPFWGRPATQYHPHLPERKSVAYRHLSEWRQAELTLQGSGLYPHSVWKLAYAGSVGSQALLGIPVLHRLRRNPQLRDVSLVWPFEVIVPSFPPGTPGIVHAEIWPSAIAYNHESGRYPDERQVRAVVRRWQDPRPGRDTRRPFRGRSRRGRHPPGGRVDPGHPLGCASPASVRSAS